MSMGRRVNNGDIDAIAGLAGDVIFSIRDNRNTSISGTIEAGATIRKTGSGSLLITAVVEEKVKFFISEMGDVVFAHRPPESVVKAIEKSGKGEVIMPGGYSPGLRVTNEVVLTASSVSNGFNTVNILASMTLTRPTSLAAHRPSLKLKEPLAPTLVTAQPVGINAADYQLSQRAKSIYQAKKTASQTSEVKEQEQQLAATLSLSC